MISGLPMVRNVSFMKRLLAMRIFKVHKPRNAEQLKYRCCLNQSLKLSRRIRPDIKASGCSIHMPRCNQGNQHMLVKRKPVLLSRIFPVIFCKPIWKTACNVGNGF